MTLTVRPSTPLDDIDALIASLNGENYPGSLAGHTHTTRTAWLNATAPLARWVAVNGPIVGHVQVQHPGPWLAPITSDQTHLEVARLMVHPDHRRTRIAHALLEHACQHIQARQQTPILCVSDYLTAPIALYESTGWTHIGTVMSLSSADRLLVYTRH